MRGIQIINFLKNIDAKLATPMTSIEKATEFLKILIRKRDELEITLYHPIKDNLKHSFTSWIDDFELRNEIEWSIKIVEIYIKDGSFNYLIIPKNQLSVDDSKVIEKISEYIVLLLEKNK